MRRALAALALVLFALPAMPSIPGTPAQSTAVPAAGALRITEIMPDPDSTLGQREFVEIWNSGTASVELAGWKLRDAPTTSGATNTFSFPAWSLPANGRVVVWGGGAPDNVGPAWSNPSVWNNAGDSATLLDSGGNAVEWFGFGTGQTAPTGFESRPIPAKPPKGSSLEWDGNQWLAHEPTPGRMPGAILGTLSLEIKNAPPVASFASVPRSVRPGTTASIPVMADDGNGAADVASWALLSGNNTLAQGTAPPTAPIQVAAPSSPMTWALRLDVTDRSGLVASATTSIPVRWTDLTVLLPADKTLHFPARMPAGDSVTLEGVTLRNDGTAPLTPRIDVSPLRGPASVDLEGRLSVGYNIGNATAWVPYTGPLTALPGLEPGAAVGLLFRLEALPPMPAGSYGTSFTVVA